MDTHRVRPRYFGGKHKNSDLSASASSHEPVAVVLKEQEQIRELTAGHNAPAISLDFASGAKAYKKHRSRHSIIRGFKIATTLSATTVLVLGAFGLWLNHTYAGRALPFSYVGGISVGGLDHNQIKQALNNRTKDLKVTFIDGGLTRTVPASQFGATFDTETAAEQIIPDFNPFAFLDRRSIDVPVKINDYQVDGYMRININPGQTKPSDAQIVKDKTKLVVAPQVLGFRSDHKFVAEQVRLGLAKMQNPLINVNAVTVMPKIAAADLEDDVINANKLLGTNITVSYGNSINVVTQAQKMAWLEFNASNGTKNVQISFSRSLVRQYVVGLAQKYQKTILAPIPAASTELTAVRAPVTPPEVIDNIEQVTDSIVAGLNSGQATASKFVASKAQPTTVSATPQSSSSVATLSQN